MTAPAPLSISDATSWTQAFLRREWRLTYPVALALMGLPAVILELFAPAGPAVAPGDMEAAYAAMSDAVQTRLILGIPAALCALLGALTISALALVPGISVGEALKLAGRRLLKLIGATLIGGAAAGAAAVVAALLLFTVTGVPNEASRAHTSAGVTVMILVMLAVTARLCLITPIVADAGIGALAAVRRSWTLSKGHFWRLLALLGVVVIASMLVSIAVQSTAGVLGWLLVRATGVAGLADGIVAIASALLNAGVSMAFSVLLTAVYRQLASRAI